MFGSTPSSAQAVLELRCLPVLASWKPSGNLYLERCFLYLVYILKVLESLAQRPSLPLYYSVWYIASSRQLGGRPDTRGE